MKNPKEKISATDPDAPAPTNLTKETLTRVFLTREDLDKMLYYSYIIDFNLIYNHNLVLSFLVYSNQCIKWI